MISQWNDGIYEIKDEATLADLKNHYNYNYSKGNVHTPIICGSVINGTDHNYPYNKMSFERKLRMMRVELFATLSISENMNFV